MQRIDGNILYSASDLANFLECEYLTRLDRIDLDTPLPRSEDDAQAKLIQDRGYAHEARYAEYLKQKHTSFRDIAGMADTLAYQVHVTRDAMRAGVEIIYQATLLDGPFIGHADFLRRVPVPSNLGNFSYEVIDTKLARTAKARFLVQLAFYSSLLAKEQGVASRMMHVVFGDQTEQGFPCAEYNHYFKALAQRFLTMAQQPTGEASYPLPCHHCDFCKWRELCKAKRIADDHLCLVANIRNTQIKKLQAAGVHTLEALAKLPPGAGIPKLLPQTLEKIASQAAIQWKARLTGHNQVEILVLQEKRGFLRLPKPSNADLFFDMEGDPLEDNGLEYLFGLYYFEQGKPRFKSFWAHTHTEERLAFEQFMDFVTAHLAKHPEAHIYHYAAYEETALKRLMSLHGTREAEVDNLLRTGRLIDLYKVVREGIRVSEPRYSIKNLEKFYMQSRSGEVTNAGASIVYYEQWKETGDPRLLREIEEYNHEDVRSTHLLREWLLTMRPADLPWANEKTGDPQPPKPGELTDYEQLLIRYRQLLVDPLPEDRAAWGEQEHLRELTYLLLDFHRRADKPHWWAMFNRRQMSAEDLLEDNECLACLTHDPATAPIHGEKSILYTCLFPEQETKLKSGDSAVCIETNVSVSALVVDEEARRVTFKYTSSDKYEPLPENVFSLGPAGPVNSKIIREALIRYADSLITQNGRYPAIKAILTQQPPRITGHIPGTPIIDGTREALPQIIQAISNLDHSTIFVQGPPGSGKTYTGAHVITALLANGYRVGVSSNSHKAINNLLGGVERVAKGKGVIFRGAKKSSSNKPESLFNGACIKDVFSNDDAIAQDHQLIAGTAWLFSDEDMDQELDFLFIDEAGQVALANLVAMGTSARNIVLLGDQMQLGQPIQGVHPGRSGESSLEFLLNGQATIPPDRGIFLETTWRMHPHVCHFISEAVYEGRLEPEPRNAVQTLLLGPDAHPALAPSGVRYIPVEHTDCSQRSEQEGEVIRELVGNLLRQGYRDRNGNEHALTIDNLLVVAPYNMQVNLLRKMLPAGARVGTVDKFQGQEAEVVIVSMTTSNGDSLPRHLGFLYSKNRLNVAISRAKCLALLVANPALMAIPCKRPEEMALVNTLCWVREYSGNSAL